MSALKAQYVQDELDMRESLKGIVGVLLQSAYEFTGDRKDRLGRGLVHHKVHTTLGLVHNNVLSDIIKAALKERGAVPTCSRGTLYYGGLRAR